MIERSEYVWDCLDGATSTKLKSVKYDLAVWTTAILPNGKTIVFARGAFSDVQQNDAKKVKYALAVWTTVILPNGKTIVFARGAISDVQQNNAKKVKYALAVWKPPFCQMAKPSYLRSFLKHLF